MQSRSSTIIGAGIAVALLGALMVFAYARSVEGKATPAAGVPAFVVTTDVPAGTRWEDVLGSLKEAKVPPALRPATAVSSTDQLAGRIAVRPISSGEILTRTQFGATAAVPAGGLEIPPGHNAITVSLPVPQGVGRYAQPGDLVNVFVTFKGEGTPNSTKLLLSNVQVLSAQPAGIPAAASKGQAAGGDVVLTLALNPDAAEKLIFAKENGSLWFGLVYPGDPPASTGGRNYSTVLK